MIHRFEMIDQRKLIDHPKRFPIQVDLKLRTGLSANDSLKSVDVVNTTNGLLVKPELYCVTLLVL